MPEVVFVVLVASVVAMILGSFFNVVISRLPTILHARWNAEVEADASQKTAGTFAEANQPFSLSFPASHCPNCQTAIRYHHNVPVLGYLFLRGRCHACKASISPWYPIIELASLGIALLALVRFGLTPAAGAAFVLGAYLLILGRIDARTQLLPDVLTLSLLWLGLLASLAGDALTGLSPSQAIIGAVAGYAAFWVPAKAFALVVRRTGMGNGDFKLAAALGAWVGLEHLPLLLILASGGCATFGILGLVTGRLQRETPMPFGPWLAVAGGGVYFFTEPSADLSIFLSGL